MDNVGLILWDGSMPEDELFAQHSIMRGCGINRVCVAGSSQKVRPNSLITIFEKNPIGSYAALVRGINYCEMSMFSGESINQSGVLVHYADSPITPVMISKIMQVSTICETGMADIIVLLRLVDDSDKPKYAVGHNGLIEGVQERTRGHENFGSIFVKRGFLKDAPKGFTKIHEYIDWAVKTQAAKIYGLIMSCSK